MGLKVEVWAQVYSAIAIDIYIAIDIVRGLDQHNRECSLGLTSPRGCCLAGLEFRV